MVPVMIDRRPPTTNSAIQAFERALGLALPTDYKAFLLATNGGVPQNARFPVRGRSHDPFDEVQSFLGIGVQVPTNELSYASDIYNGGIPSGIVPIANQAFGNYVCLDLRGGTARVTLWDHRHFWSTGEWREVDLYEVADSFEEFLMLLG